MIAVQDLLIILLAVLLTFALAWLIVRQEITLRAVRRRSGDHSDELAMISHQLRTPFTSMQWYLEMMLNQEFGKLQVAQLEILHVIQENVLQTNQILDALLRGAALEHYGVTGSPLVIDACKWTQKVIESLKLPIEQKEHTLLFPNARDRVLVRVNPLLLHSILDSLVSNAIYYTPKKGTITLHIEQQGDDVRITVQDNGIGIAKDDQDTIFSKFARGKEAQSMRTEGSGLGLHLTKSIVEKLGGSIDFTSNPGKGTTFWVQLPA